MHNVLAWTTSRKNELCNYYNRRQPEIILLNSTGTINEERIKIFNYNVHEKNYLNERNAGIAIAVRKDIKYKLYDNFNDDILAIEVDSTKGPIIIATLYSPPRRQYLPIGEIKRLMQKNIPVYLLGDLNANHELFGYNRSNMKGDIIKDLIDRGHTIHKGPFFNTLVRQKGRPDIVLVNRYDFLDTEIIQGDVTTSDHLPIEMLISTKPIRYEKKKIKDYGNTNWDMYKQKIEEKIEGQDRDIPLQGRRITKEIIDEAMGRWMADIIDVTNEVIPEKEKMYYTHPIDSDFIKILEMTYDTLRNKVFWTEDDRQMIRNIQEQIKEEATRMTNVKWTKTIEQVQDYYGDPRKFWNKIRRFMGGKETETPYLLDARGNRIYDDIEKERKFREIWENIFQISDAENRNYDGHTDRRVNQYMTTNEFIILPYETADLDRLNIESYLTRPTTRREIKQIIKEMKNGKAPGKSGINKVMLINLPDIAYDRYVDIINLTLSLGYFPVVLKNGVIILIPKPGKDPKIPTNYRPITLLEVPGKILERIINKRLQRFCEEENKYNQNQYGFRKFKGTEIAISKLYETIALNQKYHDNCNVITRDISKAFDKVWHTGLKYKLTNLQLPPIITKILSSYITERTAQIRYKSLLGPKFNIKSGVPQGGILSPTLFILYTADLPPAGQNCQDIVFADDVTQVIQNFQDNREELARNTEREIRRVNDFEHKWKICTNIDKFKLISISKSRPSNININGRRINFNNDAKILGLTIGRTGVIKHIEERIRQARIQSTKIKRFIKLKTKLKLHLYKSLIRPILEYPVIPLAMASKSQMLKMQRIQNRNIRFIRKYDEDLENKTMEDLHEVLKLEPINIRLYRRLEKLWTKFEDQEEEIFQQTTMENLNNYPDHRWWKRAAKTMQEGEPERIIT